MNFQTNDLEVAKLGLAHELISNISNIGGKHIPQEPNTDELALIKAELIAKIVSKLANTD
ncbi:hypothetical protein ES703_26384 [subsurface metagenome]